MDDLTRYVLIGAAVLAGWFALSLTFGYVFHRHVEARKRLFMGHDAEAHE